ncbi:galactose mutarotase [Latilactobacillus curvatus]|uniref:Maltose epimerase n=1 Tax=Latilactobacillus curvatus TaxID=28038 RepID=A0AAC9Y198_LATCU|nr:aldose epimerase family protein [Latilactobacillus curvatus]ASN60347.1 galactose mutarotase [Latilactobacillus curvatus]
MQIIENHFDCYQEQPVQQIRLINDHHVSVSFLTLGAVWYEFLVPSTTGHHNLLLNFPHSADYLTNPFYVGMAIGRTAGRLANGQFESDGQSFTLPTNENQHTLHGGPHGFNQFIWSYTTKQEQDSVSVTFERLISHLEDGYPGNLSVKITYCLDNNNQVTLSFAGVSDAQTLFNPTSHAYFNLSDSNQILDQTLQIHAQEFLELDAQKIPTGQFNNVLATPFDFTHPQQLGSAITALKNTPEKGIDDLFHVKPQEDYEIAILRDPKTKRKIRICSNRNGLVVFTANSFTNQLPFKRGNGQPHMGIALEPQTLPKSPDYQEIQLAANISQQYCIRYQYSAE